MIIIGTSAYPGSGQDVLADLIVKKFLFKKYSMGDFIRNIAKERGVEPTRPNLQQIRMDFDNKSGKEHFPNLISEIIRKENQNAIITGIRTKEEFLTFKHKLNLYLIFVYANDEIRVQRVLKRGEIKDPRSIEEFIDQEKKEGALFNLPFLKENADYVFECNKEWSYYVDNFNKLVSEIPIFSAIKLPL